MPDGGKWHGEMGSSEVIQYKIGDLKEDIDELKRDMRQMSVDINELANVHNVLSDYRKSLDAAWKEIRSIQETCLTRQHQIEWVRAHERDETPQDWWERMISVGVAHGIWIIISVIAATIISKIMG